jgi:hypothetical protein
MPILCRFFIALFFIFSSASYAQNWYSLDINKKATLHVELFLSSQCPHCHKADAFFREIEARTPWIHITRYTINTNKQALLKFNERLSEQNSTDFSVPSMFFCNSRWVGFDSANTTGKDLYRALIYCKKQIEQKGSLAQETTTVLNQWANANKFNSKLRGNPSALQYVTVVALMDANNPCALFCTLGFFALLFIQNKRNNLLFTGLIFVLTVATVHYIQQTHATLFYELLAWLRLPAVLVGFLTLFLIRHYYNKRKVNNLLYLLAFLLAFLVQSYQQTCVMNWSYIFQHWLSKQTFSSSTLVIYQLFYQILYLIPLLVILFVYILVMRMKTFSKRKLQLTIFGFLLLSVLALFLIIYPKGLSNYVYSILSLVFSLGLSWILARSGSLKAHYGEDV